LRQFAPLAAVAAFVAIWVVPPAPASPSATAVVAAPALERSVLDELNAVRARVGARPLVLAGGLAAAAAAHGRSMLSGGFFAHESPDGEPSWLRIARFYPRTDDWRVGENMHWRAGPIHARVIVRAWLDSPPHRAVLLSPLWREIGLAALKARRAPGVYGGRSVTVVVADFGSR
jgi:uncharacterized protein YkwD